MTSGLEMEMAYSGFNAS